MLVEEENGFWTLKKAQERGAVRKVCHCLRDNGFAQSARTRNLVSHILLRASRDGKPSRGLK